MRILITGSRTWRDWRIVRHALEWAGRDHTPSEITVVHGGAAGADSIADNIARNLGYSVEIHRADWTKYGKRAGAIRNAEMAKLGADICLAFWDNSPGTEMMIKMARKAGIEVEIYESQ